MTEKKQWIKPELKTLDMSATLARMKSPAEVASGAAG